MAVIAKSAQRFLFAQYNNIVELSSAQLSSQIRQLCFFQFCEVQNRCALQSVAVFFSIVVLFPPPTQMIYKSLDSMVVVFLPHFLQFCWLSLMKIIELWLWFLLWDNQSKVMKVEL